MCFVHASLVYFIDFIFALCVCIVVLGVSFLFSVFGTFSVSVYLGCLYFFFFDIILYVMCFTIFSIQRQRILISFSLFVNESLSVDATSSIFFCCSCRQSDGVRKEAHSHFSFYTRCKVQFPMRKKIFFFFIEMILECLSQNQSEQHFSFLFRK